MKNELVTVVVPCYNEQEVLPMFREELMKVTEDMELKYPLEFEYLFINDGSSDDTIDVLRKFSEEDSRFRYVSFSRNFGKEAAMLAGMEHSKGDYVVIMDADLQHPPTFLPQMYGYVRYGDFDCAATRRVSRQGEPKTLSFFSRSFYKVINKMSSTRIVDGAQDFRFMTRQMVDAVISMQEYNRFSKGIFSWVGFRTKYIEHENVERAAGKTAWSFRKLLLYAFDGIAAFSTAPLFFSVLFAAFFCTAAVALLITAIALDSAFRGVLSALFFVGGVQLLCTGIMGQYLAKTYMEVKGRPKYIIGETEEIYRKRKEE